MKKSRLTKSIFILISLMVIFSFAFWTISCTAETTAETTAAQEVSGAKLGEGLYFRWVTHGGDDPFWAVVQKGLKDANAILGCKADVDLCGGDLALQQKRFEEAVAMKANAIALCINDDKLWDPLIEDAVAKGIIVIGIDTDDSEAAAGNARQAFVGQDERQAARNLATRLIKEGKDKGVDFTKAHVAMSVEIPGAVYGVVRSQVIEELFKAEGVTSFEILDASMEMTAIEQRTTSYLASHPETTFLIGLGGICTDRLAASLKGANKQPGEIIAGGFDSGPGAIEGLKDKYVTCFIDSQQYTTGYLGTQVMVLACKYGMTPSVSAGGYIVDTEAKLKMIEELSPQLIR